MNKKKGRNKTKRYFEVKLFGKIVERTSNVNESIIDILRVDYEPLTFMDEKYYIDPLKKAWEKGHVILYGTNIAPGCYDHILTLYKNKGEYFLRDTYTDCYGVGREIWISLTEFLEVREL